MADVLSLGLVEVNATVASKEDAISRAGGLLVRNGCVDEAYVKGMLAREKTMSTFIGNGVAIPHGEFGDIQLVHHTGISVLQVPEGVEWDSGQKAFLIVGIAAVHDEHIKVLQNLALVVEDEATAEMLAHTPDPQVIVDYLNKPIEEEE